MDFLQPPEDRVVLKNSSEAVPLPQYPLRSRWSLAETLHRGLKKRLDHRMRLGFQTPISTEMSFGCWAWLKGTYPWDKLSASYWEVKRK